MGQTSNPSLAWKKADVFKIYDDDVCLNMERKIYKADKFQLSGGSEFWSRGLGRFSIGRQNAKNIKYWTISL